MSNEQAFDKITLEMQGKASSKTVTELEREMFKLLMLYRHELRRKQANNLSDIDVMRMRAMAKELPINQVADLFDVSPNFAYKVITNRVRKKPKNIGQLCKDLYGSIESIVDTGKHIS